MASSIPASRESMTIGALARDQQKGGCDAKLTYSNAWADRLRAPGPWVGGFDLPFGLPRELVETLGWPTDWAACMAHYARLSREQIRGSFAAFCDARPVGGKFAHRATDGPAGSSPSMKWVNPPVAFMLHAGVPRLIAAGLTLAALPALALDVETYAGKVTVEGTPSKVAVFDIAALDTLLAIGVMPAGIPENLYLSELSDMKGKAEVVGDIFEPNLEALSALAPDLIIVGGRSSGKEKETGKVAPSLDMTMDGVDVVDQARERAFTYGAIFAKQAEAEKAVIVTIAATRVVRVFTSGLSKE